MLTNIGAAKYQYLAAISASTITFGYGLTVGWTSPYLPLLMSENSPLPSGPLSSEEGSWIAASICIGGATGAIIFGWLSGKFGRKISLMCAAAAQALHWILIAFAINPTMLYIARIIGGWPAGASFAVIPVFTSEILHDKIKGVLGSLLIVFQNVGLLVGYTMGAFLPYFVMPLVSLCFSAISFVGLALLPETPFFLLTKNNQEKAQEALGFYRGIRRKSQQQKSEEFMNEFNVHLNRVKLNENGTKPKISWSDFHPPAAGKTTLIVVIAMLSTQLSGGYIVSNYAATIFKESDSILDPNISAILMAVPPCIGSYLSLMFIYNFGRKILLIPGALIIALSFITLSGYIYLKEHEVDVTAVSWIPIICTTIAITSFYACLLPVTFLICVEILPPKIANFMLSMITAVTWMIGFSCIKFFPILVATIRIYRLLWIFSGFCLFEVVFLLFLLPETKGKSYEEVIILLKSKATSRNFK